MLGCVIIDDPELLRSEINLLKDDILHNHRYSRILGKFSVNGFHYSENPLEIRNEFLTLLSRLTFNAYICFVDNPDTGGHRNDLYDDLFETLICDRLKDYRYQPVTICFEQHDSRATRRLDVLSEIVIEADSRIKAFHQVNGVSCPKVISAGKDEPCLAIADYVCAIFTTYYNRLHSGDVISGEPFEKRDFDELRSKIRLIHDYKNGTFYSRKNPFPDIP